MEIFENYDQNWTFHKISTKIFRKFRPKLWFPNIMSKIDALKILSKSKFCENIDQNREFVEFWPKLKIFQNFDQNQNFPESLIDIDIF